MLLLRILSALVGIPLVLLAVHLGGPWYALLLLLIVNLGAYEYNKILKAGGYSVPVLISYFGVSMFTVVLYLQEFVFLLPLVVFTLFLLFIFILLNIEKVNITDASLAFWGIIYIGGLCGYILLLRQQPDGALYTYMLLAGVWINDTLAYFIGSKWGFRELAPQISAQKSVEGSLAGIGGAVVIFLAISIFFPDLVNITPGLAVILAIGITVFAQLGDLMESSLKRKLQVKDTGGIIPGHGGVLDRFDSLMLAAPFVYYFFMLVNML
ncbi:MAG: phosphatidate cytidylyltransferase [Bacillota bacterium]